MITNFKIFEMNYSWNLEHINSDFEDEHEIYIDGYFKGKDDGMVLAKVDIMTGEVKYECDWATSNKMVQDEIEYLLTDVVPVRREEIEQEKYNL
jgi:hypothetical protein